jgi:beta-lactam-binding protein with PASTA domain
VSGLLPKDALDVLKAAGFKGTVASNQVASLFPQGTVAYTSPPGGGEAPPGSTITIYLSNGQAPKPSPSPSSGKPSKPPKGPSPSPTPSTSTSCSPKPHGPKHC